VALAKLSSPTPKTPARAFARISGPIQEVIELIEHPPWLQKAHDKRKGDCKKHRN
jgi:hypothetical protein